MKHSFQNGDLIPVASLTTRSLENHQGAAEQQEDEIPNDELAESFGESDRRRFLSLMAGSLALAGLTGCTRQPTEQIYPYVEQPENVVPGIPKYYATAVPLQGGVAEGVIVESHLGRPTKAEGNPDHPASLGATSVLSQACLMDLYDADRVKEIKYLGVPRSWEDFLVGFGHALTPIRNRNGAGLHILTETVVSPTLASQLQTVLKMLPAAQWHQYDPAGNHTAKQGSQQIFGRVLNTYYSFEPANVVVSLDADFLASGPNYTRQARGFAKRRRQGNRTDMNRLYVVESDMTSTGGKADHRLALRPSEVEQFAQALAAAVSVSGVQAPANYPHQAWVAAASKDLLAHPGASVVIPGDQQSPTVHALAHLTNAALKNTGKTVFYTEPLESETTDQIVSLRSLVQSLQAGQVDLLLILSGNPVYNAPADFDFAKALPKAKTTVRLGLHEDETAALCQWTIPQSHFLEEWGDVRTFNGAVTIQQPLIAPLYDSCSQVRLLDVMLQWPGRATHDIVRAYWNDQQKGSGDFESFWRKAIHDGVVPGSAFSTITPAIKGSAPSAQPAAEQTLEISFRPDIYLYDGRYANNVWLQELPRPMTKLTWDNAVFLSPRTAKQLKLENQQRVELRCRNRRVIGSVWITPGHPDDSTTVHLGYGRSQSGRAGNGAGFSAYPLRTSDALWSVMGGTLAKVDEKYPLATTQMQQTMEDREPVISQTVEEYRSDPVPAGKKAKEPAKNETLYPQWSYTGYAWGMSIDLTACVNCSACVIACQAENNIPVVGKGQVLARRAMHWIRIDTYYEGNLDHPTKAHYQPVPCMQCENAPCELVCPVQATNHSTDGLNDMVYNRCVGTRYCSNNCPYKVRRFNFLLYADWYTEQWKLQRNPDVSVRSRGVMEKCTYCVQRIREAEITARDRDGYITDGAIQTACQQVCPTEAIIFGDINNPANKVAKLKAEKLNYSLLAELNTRPRTTYLAELRNPNPDLQENKA